MLPFHSFRPGGDVILEPFGDAGPKRNSPFFRRELVRAGLAETWLDCAVFGAESRAAAWGSLTQRAAVEDVRLVERVSLLHQVMNHLVLDGASGTAAVAASALPRARAASRPSPRTGRGSLRLPVNVSSTIRDASLSSGLLPLPHLGD